MKAHAVGVTATDAEQASADEASQEILAALIQLDKPSQGLARHTLKRMVAHLEKQDRLCPLCGTAPVWDNEWLRVECRGCGLMVPTTSPSNLIREQLASAYARFDFLCQVKGGA